MMYIQIPAIITGAGETIKILPIIATINIQPEMYSKNDTLSQVLELSTILCAFLVLLALFLWYIGFLLFFVLYRLLVRSL